MAHLVCSKTKLVKLCREFGYDPAKDATYQKALRSPSWWLKWSDNGIYYSAWFSTTAGRAVLGVTKEWYSDFYNDNTSCWNTHNVPWEQLNRLGLVAIEKEATR